MRRALLAFCLLSLLTGCSSLPDTRPAIIRDAEERLFLGIDSFNSSDYHRAAEYFYRALFTYRSIDDSEGVLITRINLIETALMVKNTDGAQRQLDLARAEHARGETDPAYARHLQLLQARTDAARNEREAALANLESLLPLYDDQGNPSGQRDTIAVSAVLLRSELAFRCEDADEAGLWLQRLQRTVDRQNPLQLARLMRFEAEQHRRAGKWTEAEQDLKEALEHYRERAHRPGIAESLREWSQLLRDQGRKDEAEAHAKRAEFIETLLYLSPVEAPALTDATVENGSPRQIKLRK